MRWSERQAQFGAALLDRGGAVPAGLVGPDGLPSAKRFAVYRNNVILGLANGLGEAYPVVKRLVGADFFRAMAAEFAADAPPAGPLMFDYGADFPAFLEGFPPVAELPYLADLARLERAWVEAYHAAEEAPLDPASRQDLAGRDPSGLRLRLHGSLRFVRSDFPVVTIWQAHLPLSEPGPIDLAGGGEAALIARPGAEVALRRLDPALAAFLVALRADQPLGAAAEAALAADPGADIAAAVAGLFAMGLVTGLA